MRARHELNKMLPRTAALDSINCAAHCRRGGTPMQPVYRVSGFLPQGQQSHARRDDLLSWQAAAQKRWNEGRIFEVDAPETGARDLRSKMSDHCCALAAAGASGAAQAPASDCSRHLCTVTVCRHLCTHAHTHM